MSIVDFLKILYYISIIVWLFPPLRQWNRKYFYFFLILALADPISITITLFIRKPIHFYFPLVSIILLLSIINYKDIFIIRRNLFIYFITIIAIVISLFFVHSKLLVVLIHFIISIIFIKEFIVKYVFEREFNFYYVVLIFYEFTIILKFFNVYLGFSNATAFFIITTIFQIAFGLFFSIFREDKTRIALKSR